MDLHTGEKNKFLFVEVGAATASKVCEVMRGGTLDDGTIVVVYMI